MTGAEDTRSLFKIENLIVVSVGPLEDLGDVSLPYNFASLDWQAVSAGKRQMGQPT